MCGSCFVPLSFGLYPGDGFLLKHEQVFRKTGSPLPFSGLAEAWAVFIRKSPVNFTAVRADFIGKGENMLTDSKIPPAFEAVRDRDEEIFWHGKPEFIPFILRGMPFLLLGLILEWVNRQDRPPDNPWA